MAVHPLLGIEEEQLAAFCREHSIERMWFLGATSELHERFGLDGDVGLLVDFEADARLSFWDVVGIQEQLADLLGQSVDLVETAGLTNPIRRHEVLRSRRLLYAA